MRVCNCKETTSSQHLYLSREKARDSAVQIKIAFSVRLQLFLVKSKQPIFVCENWPFGGYLSCPGSQGLIFCNCIRHFHFSLSGESGARIRPWDTMRRWNGVKVLNISFFRSFFSRISAIFSTARSRFSISRQTGETFKIAGCPMTDGEGMLRSKILASFFPPLLF